MKALCSVLTLKLGLNSKIVVYASYKNQAFAPLLPDTLINGIKVSFSFALRFGLAL